jgi:hypothetical protein
MWIVKRMLPRSRKTEQVRKNALAAWENYRPSQPGGPSG